MSPKELADPDRDDLYALLDDLLPLEFFKEYVATKELHSNTARQFLLQLCREHADKLSPSTTAKLKLLGGLRGLLNLPSSLCSQILLDDQTPCLDLDDVILHYWAKWDANASTKQYATLIFENKPAAVISSLVTRGSFGGLVSPSIQDDVLSILDGLDGDLNLLREPLSSNNPAFESISDQRRHHVLQFFTSIQQLCQVIIQPTDLPVLMSNGFSSIESVAYSPFASFQTLVSRHGIDAGHAKKIHHESKRLQNMAEQVVTSLVLSTSSQALSKVEPAMFFAAVPKAADKEDGAEGGPPPGPPGTNNMSSWFGDLDDMGCPDCCSVTSPAAYFVDLLRFLKTTFASSQPQAQSTNRTSSSTGLSSGAKPPPNSLLAKLFMRRPELGDLLLSCRNTSERVLYVDLVNEILESATIYLENQNTIELGLAIDCHNADSHEDFDQDLCSSPSVCSKGKPPRDASNINYELYDRVISKAVFPSSVFPYSHSLDTLKSYLEASDVSVSSLLSHFQPCIGTDNITEEHKREALARAFAASVLNLTSGDFVALTEESFHTLDAARVATGQPDLSEEEYQKQAGLKPPWHYWGYPDNDIEEGDGAERMLQTEDSLEGDETCEQLGLTFVKKQLLPRLGESFATLIDLLKTRFMARSLVIIPFSGSPSSSTTHGRVATQLQDFRLHSADGGRLNVFALKRLEQIVRLWRRCKQDNEDDKMKNAKGVSWSLVDVDDALHAFGELPKAESLAAESIPESHRVITPKTIKEIAAISELARLAKIDPNRVIALFEKSAKFLQDLAISKTITRVQPQDTKAITITSQYLPLLLVSLDLDYSDFVQIQADEQLSPDTLITVDTIFLLYRLSALAKLMQVPYARLPSLLSALRERVGVLALSSPQNVLTLLKIWQGFTGDGWTAENFVALFDKTPASEADVRQKTIQFISEALKSPMTMTPSPLANGNTESSLLISQSVAAAAQSLVPNQTLDMINVFLNLPTTTPLSSRRRAQNTIRDALSGVLEQVCKTPVTPQGERLNNSFILFTQDTTMTVRCTVSQGSDAPKSLQFGANRICQLTVRETESTGSHTTTNPTQLEGKLTVTISQSESVLPVLYMSWPSHLSDFEVSFEIPRSLSDRQNAPPPTSPRVIPASMMTTVETEVRKLQTYGQLLQQYKLCEEEIQTLGPLLFRPSANEIELLQKNQLYSSIRKSLARPGMEVALALLVQWFCVVGQPLGTVTDVACRFSQASLLTQPLAENLLVANFQVATSEAILSSSDTHATPYERLELLDKIAQQARTLFTLGLKHDTAPLLFAVAQPRPFDQTDENQSIASTSPHIALVNHLRATLGARGANQALAAAQDKLRNKRRKALIQYLLQHPAMKSENVLDEGNLFEFFLIDVQMSSSLETTRIQQAISTIQLFVHRCLLGAETDVDARFISQDRWSWMQRYTTWEANRCVFLYPESYADPTLRDGKTEIFRSVVEEAAMQNTLDDDVVRKIIRGYVYTADEVANLRIEAACYDPERVGSTESNQGEGFYHFFARSRNSPYAYFYRSMEHTKRGQSVPSPVWTPWTRMPLEIAGHEVDAEGNALNRSGTYLVPIVWQKRLVLFMPQLVLRTTTNKQASGQSTTATATDGKSSTVQVNNPTKLSIDIKLSWTEQIESVFVAPKQSQVTLNVPATASGQPPAFESFWFEARPSFNKVSVTVYQNQLIDSAGTITSTKCHGEFVLQDASVTFCKLEKMNPSPSLSGSKYLKTQFGSLTRSSSVPELPSKLITRPQDSAVTPTDWPKLPLPDIGTDVTCTSMTWTMNSQSGNRIGIVADITVASSQASQPWFLMCSTSNSMPMFNTLADYLRKSLADDQGVDEIYRVMDKSVVSDAGRKANPALVDHGMAFGNSPSLAQCREDATPCAIYNWEAGFHNISLLVERLIALQQFDRAIKIARLVLDPTGSDIATKDQDWRPVWRFPPFRDSATRAHGTVGSLFNNLEASSGSEDTMDTRIRAWRRSPFQPHAVARNRPLAYMKRFVMKYIEALVAAGDTLFRQNSLELVPLAVQRYIEALHVFGPRPETVTELNQKKTFKSYNQLAESIDDFSNAFVLTHLSFPYYVSLEARGRLAPGSDKNLQGLLQTTYFGIQANKDFLKLRELIDDRLFKIRNSLDINGNPRTLSIWDPPINPNDLVKAVAAAGGNAGAVLRGDTGLMTPTYDCKVLPRKRFAYLLSRAFDLCSELKASSANLLASIEKKDGEGLQMLRAKQDMGLQRIITEMKIHQKKEAELGLEQLEQSRGSHIHRLEYYAALIGDLATVKAPKPDEEFNEIQQIIPQPMEEDLRLTNQEMLELYFSDLASMHGSLATDKERDASMTFLLPMPCLNVQFMGLGVSEQLPNYGQVQQMQAATYRAQSVRASEESSRASRIAQWTRQLQERRLQLNLAGREIKSVDVQMQIQKARIAAIDVDIRAQQQSSGSAAQTLDFLSTKLTNQQLYSWLESSIRATLYQTYLVALELARKVEAVYCFEKGPDTSAILSSVSSSSFISAAGYWDNSHHGLHAGEQLWLALKQLELAYMNKDESSPPFNITKNISLRQLDPAALLSFRELGDATFQLPELMFDLDFPGHYFRRIQSVAFSIHCIVGPYTTINCTATLVDHKYRASPKSSAGYAEKPGGRDERFVQENIKLPIRSIAISSGQHDSGVFDLAFNTDEFQPFEGAGAISTWRLRLPDPTLLKQFDYRSISDVVMHLRYTARDGGDGLRKAATTAAVTSIKAAASPPQSMMVDVKQDAPDSWYSLSLSGGSSRTISMRSITERLPYYAKSAAGIKIKGLVIYAAGSDEILKRLTFKLVAQQQRGEKEVRLKYAEKFGKMSKFTVGAASVAESTPSNNVTIPNVASLDLIKEGSWFLKLEDATSKDAVIVNPTDILLLIDYHILL